MLKGSGMDKDVDLLAENKRLRDLFNNATDKLEHERRLAAQDKNNVPGGFYMMSRSAEKNLRVLQSENPAASLIFSVIREHMNIGTNAVTVSNTALSQIINKSRATITRAIKYLSDKKYVQIIKVGGVNCYVVNEKIAFSGSKGQRQAVFSATVVAHEKEQVEGWDKVSKLKSTPIILKRERPIMGDEVLPPPDQTDLDLN
jgi:hypothetical protein